MTNVIAVPGLRFLRTPAAARFGHTLSLVRAEATVCELVSVESDGAGAASEVWPPSPPLQDWQCEPRTDCLVFLAVGKAGRSHWSAAIELNTDGTVRFDVAVRTQEQPQFVGSQYRQLAGPQLREDGPGALILGQTPDGPSAGWRLICDRSTTRMRVQGSEPIILIEPLEWIAEARSQTIRWQYMIEPLPR